MNTNTYVKNIAKEFGGKVNYFRLMTRLNKLLTIKENEMSVKIKQDEKPLFVEPVKRKIVIDQLKADMYEIYVNRILKSTESDYVKMIRIIELAKQVPGQHELSVFVECNTYLQFLDYADRNGIKYSDEHFYISD